MSACSALAVALVCVRMETTIGLGVGTPCRPMRLANVILRYNGQDLFVAWLISPGEDKTATSANSSQSPCDMPAEVSTLAVVFDAAGPLNKTTYSSTRAFSVFTSIGASCFADSLGSALMSTEACSTPGTPSKASRTASGLAPTGKAAEDLPPNLKAKDPRSGVSPSFPIRVTFRLRSPDGVASDTLSGGNPEYPCNHTWPGVCSMYRTVTEVLYPSPPSVRCNDTMTLFKPSRLSRLPCSALADKGGGM